MQLATRYVWEWVASQLVSHFFPFIRFHSPIYTRTCTLRHPCRALLPPAKLYLPHGLPTMSSTVAICPTRHVNCRTATSVTLEPIESSPPDALPVRPRSDDTTATSVHTSGRCNCHLHPYVRTTRLRSPSICQDDTSATSIHPSGRRDCHLRPYVRTTQLPPPSIPQDDATAISVHTSGRHICHLHPRFRIPRRQ
jgi:hypothetical protein